MMRHGFAFAAILLPLAGCVVAPPPAQPAYGGYPQPAYAPQPDLNYPGYAYNEGSPTLFVGGVTWPLVFWGGGWGYWDGYRHWHGAPGPVAGWLNGRHPNGNGLRPYGGGQYGRPSGPGFHPGQARAYGPGGGYRPAASRPAPAAHPAQQRREEERR